MGLSQVPENEPLIERYMKDKQAELLALSKPVNLKVPIDGKISAVLKRPGERVRKGEAIATISAPTTDRVVGYLRQPLDHSPRAGESVEVRTRTQRRVARQGTIIHVGPSMVPLEPALLSADTRRREMGLPILISLPQDASVEPLVPGEFVDISLKYAKK
jgi:multidrug resistance efflux pump